MRSPTVSVVTTAYNEESRLSRTLSSVSSWADEIIVVDSSSTDKTASVAKKFTEKVFRQPNYPMLNKNKNFGFGKATGDWILCLDSDEEIPKELADEIRLTIREDKKKAYVGYWIARKNIIFGKWIAHGIWWPDRQLRLFRRASGSFPCKHVHEYLTVDGPMGELIEPYIHYNYESVAQYLHKMSTIYTESEVQSLTASNYVPVWYDALRFPISDFVKIYFAQEGFRDGLHGLVLSLLQSFYSFIVFAKLWEKQKFREQEIPLGKVERELMQRGKEIHYWLLAEKIKQASSPLSKILYRFLRRVTS